MSSAILTVRVPPEVAQRLERLASATHRSKSYLAAEAIEEYLALQEWQVGAILQGMEAADRDEGEDLGQVKRRWEQRLADSAE